MINPEVNDEHEVNFIALVNQPAIGSNFLAFNEDKKPLKFAITNEDERIITGLCMVANLPMYRNVNGAEFFVYFDADTIKEIAQKFFKKKYNFNLNLSHNPDLKTEDVFFFESWIIDRAKGKTPPPEFEDAEDGSWIVSAKVEDPEVWDAIKRGEFKGFSVEGLFIMQQDETVEVVDLTEDEFEAELKNLLHEYKV